MKKLLVALSLFTLTLNTAQAGRFDGIADAFNSSASGVARQVETPPPNTYDKTYEMQGFNGPGYGGPSTVNNGIREASTPPPPSPPSNISNTFNNASGAN